MSESARKSSLLAVQQNNYGSLAMVVAVGYDYILVFPKEIEYIWCKPWTRVSTLFILVRYVGLYTLVMSALFGSTFMHSLPKFWYLSNSCEIFREIERWTFLLFLGAADFIMILRVWVMYGRSRIILGILLLLFSIEVISMVIEAAVYLNPKNDHYLTILEYSFCLERYAWPIYAEVTDSLQMAFATVLCMFALVGFVRQSARMCHVTKQWQLNRYLNLLAQQGVLYYFATLLLNLIDILFVTGKIPDTGWHFILAILVEQVPAYTLIPRFIITIREMHARDVQGRHGGGIDTGFGLHTISSCDGTAGGPMVFIADVQNGNAGNVMANHEQNMEWEDIELVLKEPGAESA